jgi:nucleotide-binding universal stress UspA family protein
MKLLIADDGSAASTGTRRIVQALPLPMGSSICVLCVVSDRTIGHHTTGRTLQRSLQADEVRARQVVRESGLALKREGITVSTVVRRGDAGQEILQVAEEWQADLVVVGSRGLTGLGGLLLGSVPRTVAQQCRRPVLVARCPRSDVRQILVATDGSERALGAVDFTARLPLPEEARITVLHVVPGEKAAPSAGSQEILEQAAERLAQTERTVETTIRVGRPGAEILALAEERDVDLIVAGARGVSLIEGILVGSVADLLLREARMSVLLVH